MKKKNFSLIPKIIFLCAVILFVICPAFSLGLEIFFGEDEWEQEHNEAADALTEMLVATNVKFPYDGTVYGGVGDGRMGTGYDTNMIFIDYDSNKIGFLYYDHGGQYESFSLTKGPLTTDGYQIQKQWTLRAPGNRLTAYYVNNPYRTIAIQLEMDDQSIYSIDGLDTSDEDYGEPEISGKGYFLDIDPDY